MVSEFLGNLIRKQFEPKYAISKLICFMSLTLFMKPDSPSSSSLLREFEECAINELETFHSKIETHNGKSMLVISFRFFVVT